MTKKIAWFTSTRGVYHWSFEGDWSPKAAMATLESRNSFLLVSYLCPDHTSLCLTSIQGYLYKNSVRSSPTVHCDETQCTYVWLVADWQLCLTLLYMGGGGHVKSTKKKLMSSRVKLLQFYRTLLLAKLLLSSLGFVLNDKFQIFKSFVLLDWFIIFVIDLSFWKLSPRAH